MATISLTQAQIRRVVKGAMDAGLPIGSIEVSKDGTIRILPPEPKPSATDKRKPEAW